MQLHQHCPAMPIFQKDALFFSILLPEGDNVKIFIVSTENKQKSLDLFAGFDPLHGVQKLRRQDLREIDRFSDLPSCANS